MGPVRSARGSEEYQLRNQCRNSEVWSSFLSCEICVQEFAGFEIKPGMFWKFLGSGHIPAFLHFETNLGNVPETIWSDRKDSWFLWFYEDPLWLDKEGDGIPGLRRRFMALIGIEIEPMNVQEFPGFFRKSRYWYTSAPTSHQVNKMLQGGLDKHVHGRRPGARVQWSGQLGPVWN